MRHYDALSNHTAHRIPPIVGVAALALALTVSLAQPAYAGQVTPPDVPFNLKVPAGNKAFFVGHAFGTQNYVCKPSSAPPGVAYALFTPEATLFGEDGGQVITHFFSPNPDARDPNTSATVVADGAIRATWQHKDSSSIWAKVRTNPDGSTGAAIVDPNSVAWLLLEAVGTEDGPTGGDTLTKTTFVQRVNTVGGNPPKTGCASPADLGNQAFVDYTADYFFFAAAQ
jgi:hypothetical protein